VTYHRQFRHRGEPAEFYDNPHNAGVASLLHLDPGFLVVIGATGL